MVEKTPEGEEEYPAEEQGIEQEEGSEEVSTEMESGEKDEDVYTEEGREKLGEDAEISPTEEGFMEGAEGTGKLAHCMNCKKALDTDEKTENIEREIDGKNYWFCSEACYEEYMKKKE